MLACPRTPRIREHVGYDSLLLLIDRGKRLVRRVEYADLGGRALKSYALHGEIQLAGLWLPQQVRMDHRVDGYSTDIAYEHWLMEEAPPPALFEPSAEGGSFLHRLRALLEQAGLGERIGPEIEAANERVRAYDEKWRKRRGEDSPPRF